MKQPSTLRVLQKRLRNLVATVTFDTSRAPKGEPAPELVHLAVQRLKNMRLEPLASHLRVLWNPRMRSTAGLAYPGMATIVLNPKLRDFGTAEVERTLLHELAHLVAHHRAGRRRIQPHGLEWQRACSELGINNEARCHDLPLPRRKMQPKHRYACPHCATTLERVRAFRRAAACLPCCKQFAGGQYDPRFKLQRISPIEPSSADPLGGPSHGHHAV